jgi:MSHA biogenesis protein MshG
MPEYLYKGRSKGGDLIEGRLAGNTSEAVANRLVHIGVTPVEITATAAEHSAPTVDELWIRMGGGRPSSNDLSMFCRQMHVVTRTGLPLLQGLTGLTESTHNAVLRAALLEVIAGLESGRSLGKSLEQHPEIFPRLFVSIIKMGESTGTLDLAFLRMFEYLAMEQEIKDRVKSATRYPLTVIGAIAIALGIITVFVIPNFAPLFNKLGDNIPMATKIIIGVSDFAVNHWLLALSLIGATAGGISAYVKTELGRFQWDRLKLQLPVVGNIVRMNETLHTVATSIGNEYLSGKMSQLSAGIERGESLWTTAHATGLFTPLVLQMISLGEETGALPELLNEVADHYKREVDYDLDNLSAALEPLLMIGVGGIVLVLALGIFLPMWDMVGAIKR